MTRAGRVALVFVSAAALAVAVAVVRARVEAGGTPPWDEASHGYQGFAVAWDLARLDLPNLLADVVGRRFRYPPGHPLLLAPAYLVFGPTWGTAVGVSAALYVALVVLLFLAGRALAAPPPGGGVADAPRGGPLLAGLLASALALISPAFIGQAGTIMLELPAAALGVLVAWLYARSLDAPDREGPVRAAGWALTAFALTATQYAALWLIAVAAWEAWRCPADHRRAVRVWAAGLLRSRALWHPLHVLAALALLLAAAIVLTGGWVIPLGRRGLSMTRPGGPIVVALLALGVRVAWLAWRRRASLRAAIPARYRIFFATLVVPLYLWFFVLYPSRFAHTLDWVSSSPPSIPRSSLAYWTFYPAYAAAEAHLGAGVLAFVLLLAAVAVFRRGAPEKVRFLGWAAVCTTALVLAHHARQERFILPLLPIAWLLAAAGAAAAWAQLRPPAIRRGAAAATAAVVGAALGPAAVDLHTERLPRLVAGVFTPERLGYRDVLMRIVDEALSSPSVRVLGTFAGLSHHLFEWELGRRVDMRRRVLDFDLDHPLKKVGPDPEGPRKVFERWLAKSPEALVFAIEPIDLETRPPKPLEGLWEHDPEWNYRSMRLMRETDRYALDGSWSFPAAGLRVRKYALRGAPGGFP